MSITQLLAVNQRSFFIELVESKSAPMLGPHREAEFEHEFDSKIAALVVRMTRPIWGSGRAVIMDSGFGYVASMFQLKEKGLFATTVIKKKRFGPNTQKRSTPSMKWMARKWEQ